MFRLRKQYVRRYERARGEQKTFHDSARLLGNLKRNGRSEKAVGISEDVFRMSEKNPWRIEGDLLEAERALDEDSLEAGGWKKSRTRNDLGEV